MVQDYSDSGIAHNKASVVRMDQGDITQRWGHVGRELRWPARCHAAIKCHAQATGSVRPPQSVYTSTQLASRDIGVLLYYNSRERTS